MNSGLNMYGKFIKVIHLHSQYESKYFWHFDTETQKSAATMVVGSGNLNDPPEADGIAHFCEHMLFLGTEKYPSDNHYGDFI